MKGKFYLIPTPLGEEALHTIPQYVVEIIHRLDTFIVERAKTARHFIKATQPPYPLSSVAVFEIGEYSQSVDFQEINKILSSGKSIGIMSEAGCPGVADPGAIIVEWAHRKSYEVVPLVGPSSILLALMGSGFNGQSFQFHGYLSAKKGEIGKDLKRLEDIARRTKQAQIFIETPYRNKALIETALQVLQPNTKLCIAADLTAPPQYLMSKTIAEWKKTAIPDLHKRPTIFLIS
ncbi:MAG: SAM-dependent methyltransferase [Saprospiraceae bacterium]|nr:SAM-dependent methyltransferase [Saprospiraceae bacterium]